MIFWKLGFRNLLRNKRRTILAGLAIGFGLACMMVMDGFWLGMLQNMVKSVTTTYIGHGQIHHPKYVETSEVIFNIEAHKLIEKRLTENDRIESYSSRVLSIGMISSSNDSRNVSILGVEPNAEKKVSIFDERMLQGKFLQSTNDLVIGERLRQKLDVELGERIVVTVSESESGEIKQELFRLTGVFGIGSKDLDEGIVLIHQKKLQTLLNLNGVHEIAMKFKNIENIDHQSKFIKKLENDKLKFRTWKELVPQIVSTIEMSDVSISIMAVIMFSLVALGILNTMFMSLFERNYEFGILQAVGTRKRDILKIIVGESFTLAVVSIVIGMIIATFFGLLMMYYGVDYSGIEFGEITFTEKIYFVFSLKQFTVYPLMTLFFTVLISFYPAWHVIRKRPADVLHRSL